MSESQAAERHEFSAEVGRLLDLVVHSLYSDREIFLRELVANAADATDRRRFEALTNPALALPADAKVRIVPDKEARTILIADSGIGMDKAELAANLGTIARSGTRAFGEAASQGRGQGQPDRPVRRRLLLRLHGGRPRRGHEPPRRVGRRPGRGPATAAAPSPSPPAERDEPGTTILLHIKPDADEFLEPIRLETIVRKWADHITVPITVAHDGEDKAANEGTALWRKPKAEVTEEQYKEFYHHVAHAWDEPWATLHWRAEGALDYSALLFIPGTRPFDFLEGPRESRVRLHVRRMFITDEANLLPPWARFVQGVVDTEDLPLNVSREMLQATPVLARIRKAVTNRVLSELKTRAGRRRELREVLDRVRADPEGRRLGRQRAPQGARRADAVPQLEPGGPDHAGRLSRPHEGRAGGDLRSGRRRRRRPRPLAAARGFPRPRHRGAAADRPGRRVLARAAGRLGGQADPQRHPRRRRPVQARADRGARGRGGRLEKLIPALKAALGEAVADVRATDRLVESAVVLAAAGFRPRPADAAPLRRHGRNGVNLPPTLELNPRHELIRKLAARADAGEDLADAAHTLLDLARVQDGDMPADPAAFARRITEALAR